jgi:hypothetical protein
MFRHFLAVLVGTLIVAGAAVSDDRGQTGETKKSDPERQLIFKVKGLT